MNTLKAFVSGFLNLNKTKEQKNVDVLPENDADAIDTNTFDDINNISDDINNISDDINNTSSDMELNAGENDSSLTIDLNGRVENCAYINKNSNEAVDNTELVKDSHNLEVNKYIIEIEDSELCINLGNMNSIDNNISDTFFDGVSLNITSIFNDPSEDVINLDEFEDLFDNCNENELQKQNNAENFEIDSSINKCNTTKTSPDLEKSSPVVNDTRCVNNAIITDETEEIENNNASLDNVVFIKEFESISFSTLKAVIPVVITSKQTNISSNKTEKHSETNAEMLPSQNKVVNSNTTYREKNVTKLLRSFRKVKNSKNLEKDVDEFSNNIKNEHGIEENIVVNTEDTNKSLEVLKTEDLHNNLSVISVNSEEDDTKLNDHKMVSTIKDSNKYQNCNKTKIKLETVSLSSEETDDGYNSSDFQFISRSDAENDDFVINLVDKDIKPTNNVKTEVYTEEICRVRFDSESSQEIDFAVAGPSHRPDNYYRDQYVENNNINQENYRENHVVPEGDDYMNLFQGVHDPVLADLVLLENKSLRSLTSMTAQYEGIGFDMRLRRNMMEESEDEEYKEEAAETARKIVSTYPRENRKRRRRF